MKIDLLVNNQSGGTFNDGGGNLVWGDTSDCPGVNANPLFGTPGDYGGNVPTIPLLPGSPAINAASANCPTTDARGVARGTTCDSGAFESQGFTLTKTGGDNQATPINTAFTNPLVISVTSAYTEPVDGGVVTFVGPLTGAGANPITTTTAISGGAVSVSVTANGIVGGPYNVMAYATGAPSVNFSLTNLKSDTTTSLTSEPNPSTFGQAVTFTATVTSANGTPTGTVTFYDNAVSLGSGALNASGVATLTTSSLTGGTHPTITAIYGGSTLYNGSTSSNYAQTVNKASTATSLTSEPNPSAFGQTVIFTATVTSASGTPTGAITLTVDATSLVLPLNGVGAATYLTTVLSVGNHTITAAYAGDANFSVSSGVLSGGQTVNDVPISGLTAINSSPTRLTDSTFFTATISGGSNVLYAWNFGDGQIGTGMTTNHTYTATGTYTATVTATNGVGSVNATTIVTIEPIKVYLPSIMR
ncbi:MAG: Ig-like domain repeat protein [Chloroflexi bacterium]|nr:Ig-like domain repeat protein [Chloroflexota bacterium]